MYNGEIGANNLLSIVGWHRYKQRLNATGASSPPVQKNLSKNLMVCSALQREMLGQQGDQRLNK